MSGAVAELRVKVDQAVAAHGRAQADRAREAERLRQQRREVFAIGFARSSRESGYNFGAVDAVGPILQITHNDCGPVFIAAIATGRNGLRLRANDFERVRCVDAVTGQTVTAELPVAP